MISMPGNVQPPKRGPVMPPMRDSVTAPIPAVPMPKAETSEKARGESPGAMPAMPSKVDAGIAPIPAIGGGHLSPAGPLGGSSSVGPGFDNGRDMGRVVDLLEQLVKQGSGGKRGFEPAAELSEVPSDPVNETGWRTLFNGSPLDHDEDGNAILRRRQ